MACDYVQAGKIPFSFPLSAARSLLQGFIDPSVAPPHESTSFSDEYRMAEIFAAWLGEIRNSRTATENGKEVGRMIAERALHKGMKLRDVAKCVTKAGEFYLELVDQIEERMGGGEGSEGKGKKVTEDWSHEMQVARLMMTFFTTASLEVERMHRMQKRKQ
jgi:hypothetical protein